VGATAPAGARQGDVLENGGVVPAGLLDNPEVKKAYLGG